MRTLAAVAALLMLSGCAMSVDLTADDVAALTKAQSVAQQECLVWQAEILEMELRALEGMTKEQAYHYTMMRQQGRLVENLVASFTGKSSNPCNGGTNIYDVLIAELRERNETMRSIITTSGGVIKWGIGGLTVASAVDSVMSKVGTDVRFYGDGNGMYDSMNSVTAGRDGVIQTGDANVSDRIDTEINQTQEGTTTGPNASESPFQETATDNRPTEIFEPEVISP